MSAREKLIYFLKQTAAADHADMIVDDFAKELAEKILALRVPGDGDLHEYVWNDVVERCSEAIEPEVSGEVECSHQGLECQWSRCHEKKESSDGS